MSAAALPPEIWITVLFEIAENSWMLDHYQVSGTLGNVALVSPALQTLAQPLLFKYMFFNLGAEHMTYEDKVKKRMNGISRWMDDNPERKIGSWIKDLSVEGPDEGHDRTGSSSLLRTIWGFLKRLTHVRTICMEGILLTTEMYAIIHHLPCLSSFTYGCEGDDETERDSRVPESDMETVPFGVEHLNIGYCFGCATGRLLARVMKLVLAPQLKSLSAGGAYPDMAIALYDMAGPAFRNLSSLTLDGPFDKDPSKLYTFLASCECVTKLALDYYNQDESAVPTRFEGANLHLAKSVLPSLKMFKGPLAYANSLVPGRPVIDISVVYRMGEATRPVSQEVLKRLTRGTVPVRRLVIDNPVWDGASLKAIGQLFPDLETLQVEKMDGCYELELPQNIKDGAGSLQNIKNMRFGPPCPTFAQHPAKTERNQDYVMALSHASPSLRRFWVEHSCLWERNDTGVWKAGSENHYRRIGMLSRWAGEGDNCFFV